jgi:hypothetical protein
MVLLAAVCAYCAVVVVLAGVCIEQLAHGGEHKSTAGEGLNALRWCLFVFVALLL